MAGFRLDNSISWGDIGMGIGLLITGVLAFGDLSTRVSVTEDRLTQVGAGTTAMHAEFQRHELQEREDREAIRAELRGELRDINAKLDRLIEREGTR